MTIAKIATVVIALSVAALITACGGGGGGSAPLPALATTYSLGGAVSGLTSSGLVLRNGNDQLSVPAQATQFVFPTQLAAGTPYAVTFASQPTGLNCALANGSGVVGSANVTSVAVSCSPLASHSVGGMVSGLTSTGLVLQLNGSADLAIDVGPTFTFPTQLSAGTTYAVTVRTNPIGQICSVASGATGQIGATAVTDVVVTCITPPQVGSNYSIGGTITGLTSAGLVLANLGEQLTVMPNAVNFSFATLAANGTAYNVSIVAQPAGLTCSITNGSGTVSAVAVTTVTVTCSPTATQAGLTVNRDSLTFTAEQGASLASQVVVGTIQGATAPVFVTITHTTMGIRFVDYLQLSAVSGQVTVVPHTSNRAPGTVNDTMTVTACFDTPCTQHVAGSPKVIPVVTTILPPTPAPVLLVSQHGVAFTSAPGLSSLSRSLTVTDSSGAASGWTATSDKAWLGVTAAGVSGAALNLSASTTGLAAGFHEARVTVTSSNAAIAPRLVRVGLFITAVAPAATFTIPPVLATAVGQTAPDNWAVDPIRPLTYVANSGSIGVDHAYTGARVTTINVPGAVYGSVAIDDEGSRLYALNEATFTLDVFNLDSLTRISSLSMPQFNRIIVPFFKSRMIHGRIHGKSVLVMYGVSIPEGIVGAIVEPSTGQLLGSLGHSPHENDFLAISGNGRALYATTAGFSGLLRVTRVGLRANSLGNFYGVFEGESAGNNEGGLQDIATNFDGSRVFVAWGTDPFVRTFSYINNALTETPALGTWPNGDNNFTANIKFDPSGRLVTTNFGSTGTFRRYSAAEVLLQEIAGINSPTAIEGSAGIPRTVRMTSDGMRLLGNGRMLNIN